MQVRDFLPMLTLLKSQRVKLYCSPGGALLGSYDRTDILPEKRGKALGGLLDARLLCIDACSENINLYVETGRD